MSHSVQLRRTFSSISSIYYSPPGLSTNYILGDRIYDIVEGSVCGVYGVDKWERKLNIFLDVVGFVADYPDSPAYIDVMSNGEM